MYYSSLPLRALVHYKRAEISSNIILTNSNI
jgi:hypothetical protein